MLSGLMEEIQYRLEILGDDCLYYADRMRKPLMLAAFISVILTIKSGRESSSFMKSKLQGLGFLGGSKNELTYGGFGSYGGSSFGSSYSSSSTQATAALMDAYSNVKAAKGGQFEDYGSTTTFAGEMVTLKSVEAASPVEEALSSPGAGKVLVVDGGGSTRAAIFDANMANTARSNGWAGVIINGCVRNVESLKSISIGIKAICTHPERGKGRSHKKGAKLKIAGTIFSQGKYVYVDPDGIVVSKTRQDPVSGMGGSSFSSFGGTSSSYGTGSSYGGSSTGGYSGATSSYGTGSATGGYSGATGSYGTGSATGGYSGATGGYSGATGSYGTGSATGGYSGASSSYGTGSTGSYGGSMGTSSYGGSSSYGTGSTGSYGGGMGTSSYGGGGGGYNGGGSYGATGTGGGYSGAAVPGGGYSGGGGGGGGFSGGNFRRLRTRVATE